MIKKCIFISVILFAFFYSCIAQNLEKFEQDFHSKLRKIESQIITLEKELNYKKKKGLKVKTTSEINIHVGPTHKAKKIGEIPEGETILLHTYDGDYRAVSYNGKVGYVMDFFLTINDSLDILEYNIKKLREEKVWLLNSKNKLLKEYKNKIIKQKIKNKVDSIETNFAWIKVFKANVREEPTLNSKLEFKLDKGERVFIHEEKEDWVRIRYDAIKDSDPRTLIFKYHYPEGWIKKSLISKNVVRKLSLAQRRRKKFILENHNISENYKNAILDGFIILGMTKSMVIATWGNPKDINRSVGSWGVHEQWIYYGDKYLYFENGKLTSWQE